MAAAETYTSFSIPTLHHAPVKNSKLHWADQDSEAARRELNQRLFKDFGIAKDGGLKVMDEAEVSRQRGVVWEMIKEVGNSLLDGRELSNITLPVEIFEPKSFLEAITSGWAYAPTYLTRAALTTDPLERFKNIICFVVSGIHLTPAYRKPFNPILGETYEAKLSDGSEIFCEQTTHHPPGSNWQMVGPSNLWHFYGRGLVSASARGNTLKASQYGLNCVEFADGTKITWTLPTLVIGGALFGDRTQHYEGTLQFRDEKNKLSCDLIFNADGIGFIKSLFTKQKSPVDWLRGDVVKTTVDEVGKKKKEHKEVLCTVEGSWLSHLDFGDERRWDVDKDLPHLIVPIEDPLPSDCRYRDDLQALLENDIQRGGECKFKLEEQQRYDERLRSAAAAAKHKITHKEKIKGKPVALKEKEKEISKKKGKS